MKNSDEDEISQPPQCHTLPLHTSQSVPILYRSTSSFSLNRSPGPTDDHKNSIAATHTHDGGIAHENQISEDEANVSNSENDGDDDDTSENACDIEDQASATTSSFSMTSISAMTPRSKFGRLSHTSLTGEATSSDSEDAAPHTALFYANSSRPYYAHRSPTITRTDSGSGSSNSAKKKKSKIRRSDFSSSTLSSVGTFSKHKHIYSHRQGHGQKPGSSRPCVKKSRAGENMPTIRQRKQRVQFSVILAIIKSIALLWTISVLSFLFYHVCIYNPPESLPMTPLAKLTPGNHNFNHIPFPPSEHKISVVLMNHSRPRMIKESTLVPTLLHHPSVKELIILHSNPKTAFKFVHPKVVNIDATKENDQMGLSVRFYFCQLAKSDWVLHVDDDMEFTEKTLNEMLSEFSKNTKRIVGRFGRNRKENSYFNGYSSKDTSKESEVILTKFMVMERESCSAFFKYSHLVWEDIILNNGEGPLWNGEDVFMSLVSNHVYGARSNAMNYAMDWLDVRSAPEELKDYTNGKFDISGGFSGLRFWDFAWWRSLFNRNRHYSYRGTLWKQARERLETSEPYVR